MFLPTFAILLPFVAQKRTLYQNLAFLQPYNSSFLADCLRALVSPEIAAEVRRNFVSKTSKLKFDVIFIHKQIYIILKMCKCTVCTVKFSLFNWSINGNNFSTSSVYQQSTDVIAPSSGPAVSLPLNLTTSVLFAVPLWLGQLSFFCSLGVSLESSSPPDHPA